MPKKKLHKCRECKRLIHKGGIEGSKGWWWHKICWRKSVKRTLVGKRKVGRPKGGGKRKSWVFGKKMVKCQFCHKYIRTNPSLTMSKGRYCHKGCLRKKKGYYPFKRS